jgi:hypothetical protein
MRKLNTKLLIVVAMTLAGPAAFAASCAPPSTADLAGFWESRDISKGGIGHTLEFRPDGSLVEAIVVLVDLFYRTEGDQFILGETAGSDAKPLVAATIRIEGDTLRLTAPDGSVLEKERLGNAEPGRPPIQGVWRYRHPTGALAYERYTEDGRVFLRIPMSGSTGCYQVQGDRLGMSRPHRKDLSLPFKTEAGELVVKSSGKTTAYRRVAAGPWYDREHIDLRPPKGN